MKKTYLLALLGTLSFALCACEKVPGDVTYQNVVCPSNIEIHTELQKGLLETDNYMSYLLSHQNEICRYSNSAPIKTVITWKTETDNGAKAKNQTVELSKNQDFAEVMSFKAQNDSAEIYNLEINASYYGRIASKVKSKYFYSDTFTFVTEESGPRNIFVEGVENFRDLGGFKLENDKIYKQGLIYRCAQLNYDKNDDSPLESQPTTLGKDILNKQLGIKTEIDLRKNGQGSFEDDETVGLKSSPAGSSVKYVQTPMNYGGKNIFTQDINKESIQEFFNVLSKEESYPLMFHCVRGTDRTGALAYVVGALCGASQEDLINDYLFSNFANINQTSYLGTNSIDSLKSAIDKCEGEDFSSKTKSYLYSTCEISEETCNKIIDILTD